MNNLKVAVKMKVFYIRNALIEKLEFFLFVYFWPFYTLI